MPSARKEILVVKSRKEAWKNASQLGNLGCEPSLSFDHFVG